MDASVGRAVPSEGRNVESNRLYQAMQDTAQTYLQDHPGAPIFKAGLSTGHGQSCDIADLFVNQLPEDWKRDFRCYPCVRFLQSWGALVCVQPLTGDLIPLFWKLENSIPLQFQSSVEVIANALKEGHIRESFDPPDDDVIGVAEVTEGFGHMHFRFTGACKITCRHLAGYTPASTSKLVGMLEHVLKDNTREVVDRAAYLLIEDKLPCLNKHKGSIRWLQGLYNTERIMEKDERRRSNLIWYFAASSFMGCIPSLRSGAVSELLSWITKGVSFNNIQRRW